MWLTQTWAGSAQKGSRSCSRSRVEPRLTTKASQTCSGQPSDVSAFGFLQAQVALSWSLQPCSSPSTHTRRGYDPQSLWPIDLLVISRNPVKSPCKLHGFATFFFHCRLSLPAQNVLDPMIKACFDLALRSGSLEEEVKKLLPAAMT